MSVQEKINGVYHRLKDDLSRSVFENRVLYSLTNDYRFIKRIIFEQMGQIPTGLKENKGNIIVYGAGDWGRKVIRILDDYNVTAFCDKDAEKQRVPFSGYDVISPQELKEKHSESFVVLAVEKYREPYNALIDMGFSDERIWIYPFIIRDHEYFEPEIVSTVDSEIFIDAGCFNCETSFEFAKQCNYQYDKIIAFEPSPGQYAFCLEQTGKIRNMKVHPYALWNEETEVQFDVNPVTPGYSCIMQPGEEEIHNNVKVKTAILDDMLAGEKATFIKMDIEGAELNALKGAEQTICKYHPKLAICVYHKPEDIWEIPAYILSLCDDYKLYIRHYNAWYTGTVLYAV